MTGYYLLECTRVMFRLVPLQHLLSFGPDTNRRNTVCFYQVCLTVPKWIQLSPEWRAWDVTGFCTIFRNRIVNVSVQNPAFQTLQSLEVFVQCSCINIMKWIEFKCWMLVFELMSPSQTSSACVQRIRLEQSKQTDLHFWAFVSARGKTYSTSH